MSDPIPKDGETEGLEASTEADKLTPPPLPPEDLPEKLLRRRLSRLDTRRTLAELCKSIPGLEEALLPKGIQADALTRKSGGSSTILRGISRRVMNDAAAWGAFRTAVGEQIPPETFEALENLNLENVEELAEAHTTEGLLLAALSAEDEPEQEVVEALISAWREENQEAEKKATDDAHISGLEAELERLKRENERLSFASRAANERAASLGREVEVLRSEKEEAEIGAKKAEERATAALNLRGQMSEKVAELEQKARHLERILEGERNAYSAAAERLEELHEELGRVVDERDRIRDALKDARFTDEGFGDLLVRAVKNEVSALPSSLDATARTAQLMEFMGNVLRAHTDLREPRSRGERSSGARPSREEVAEDSDPSPAGVGGTATGALAPLSESPPKGDPFESTEREVDDHASSRPTLSFKALGGAGEVGGSSHLLDFGRTRVLVDAGVKP